MPVNGLPFTLEIHLQSLVKGQVLKNWNIFGDSRSIVVKSKWDLNNSHGPLTNTGKVLHLIDPSFLQNFRSDWVHFFYRVPNLPTENLVKYPPPQTFHS